MNKIILITMFILSTSLFSKEKEALPQFEDLVLKISSIEGRFGLFVGPIIGSSTNLKSLNSGLFNDFMTFDIPKDEKQFPSIKKVSLLIEKTKFVIVKNIKEHNEDFKFDYYHFKTPEDPSSNGAYSVHITDYERHIVVYITYEHRGVITDCITLKAKRKDT